VDDGNKKISTTDIVEIFAKPLFQFGFFVDNDAEQYVEERVDIISKASIENVLVGNSPNISEPVNADDNRCDQE